MLAESDHPQNLLKTGLGVRGVAGVAVLTSEILGFFILIIAEILLAFTTTCDRNRGRKNINCMP